MRRLAVLPAALCLMAVSLAACGDEAPAERGKVTVSGEFGAQPKVKYAGRVERDKSEIDVLTEGKGDEIAQGDVAVVNLYVGNGYDGEKATSTYDEGGKPEMLHLKKGAILAALEKAVVGHKVGSRVEVLAAPSDTWGETGGNPTLGIGNGDTTVWIVDIMSKVADKPTGAVQEVPAGTPTVIEQDGKPTGFDFSKSPAKPSDKLQTITLVKGEGAPVTKGSGVALRYLGQVWGGKLKSFDNNYDADFPGLPDPNTQQPGPVTIPGAVIKGWNEGLIGVTTGSRVLLVIPPAFGYGAEAKGEDLPANSTLVFVVDVLGVV